MVEFNTDVEDIFEDEETVTTGADLNQTPTMPTTIPGSMFQTPVKPGATPELDVQDLLTNEAWFAETFTRPKKTEEELAAMYPETDYGDDKWYALAKAGFALMQPTIGGSVAPSIANAGTQLLNDMGEIRSAERKAEAVRKSSMLTLREKEEGDRLSLMAQAYGMNQELLTTEAIKNHEEAVKQNTAMWENYNTITNSNMEEALKFGIKKFESKPVTFRYTNNNDIRQEVAGFLANDQYWIPTTQKDPETNTWLYELAPNPDTIELISTKTQEVDKVGKAMGNFIKVKGAFDTADKAIYSLDKIMQSLDPLYGGDPTRAGWIAGLQMSLQSYAMIASDFTKQFFSGENSYEEDGKTKSRAMWLSDLVDIAGKSNNAPDWAKAEFGSIDNMLNQLQADGEGYMQRDFFGEGNPLNMTPGQEGEAFEEGQRELIFGRIGYDKKLPENEARAQAIIYALARARKSTGRLNLDDIERAAQSINIYGADAKGVIEKLKVVREDLINDRKNQLYILKRNFPDVVADIITERGSEKYNFNYYEDLFRTSTTPESTTYNVVFDYDDKGNIIGTKFEAQGVGGGTQ